MGTPFNQLTPKVQAMVLAQGRKAPIPEAAWKAMENAAAGMGDAFKPKFGFIMEPAVKKRIRQSAKPVLNALESRYHTYFIHTYPDRVIFPQAVRVELARGIWFKPDFFCPTIIGRPTFFEVKGPKAFRGGFENLKVAARVHSWASFFLVWEDDARVWQQQEILA